MQNGLGDEAWENAFEDDIPIEDFIINDEFSDDELDHRDLRKCNKMQNELSHVV
jgi:hypothetical protein